MCFYIYHLQSRSLLLHNEHSVFQVLEEFGIPFKQLSYLRAWKRKLLYFTSCSFLISVLILIIFLGEIFLFTLLDVTARLRIKLYQYQLLYNYFQVHYQVLLKIVILFFLSQQSLERILKRTVKLLPL